MTTIYRSNPQPPHSIAVNPGPTCSLRSVPSPACPLKRAAELAAQEKKVLFLHDDCENATAIKMQMSHLAAELDSLHVTSYFGNGPAKFISTSEVGEAQWKDDGGDDGSDDDDDDGDDGRKSPLSGDTSEFRMVWPSENWHALSVFTMPRVRKLSKRKGPFYAVIGVGKAARLAKAIFSIEIDVKMDLVKSELRDFYDELTSTGTNDDKGKMTYPVFVASASKSFYFMTEKNEDSTEPLKIPIQKIKEFVKEAIVGTGTLEKPKDAKALFQQKLTNKEKQLRKLKAKEEEKEFAKRRTLENSLRKELKARKAAGEDIEVPPNPAKLARDARRELRKEANKDIPAIPAKTEETTTTTIPVYEFIGNFDNLERPKSNYVVEPNAEPVTPCTLEELQEMIEYLEQNKHIDDYQIERIDFRKGSMLNRGGMAVDLCKQVVGPEGIEPILKAVGKNEHVVRFLLGNNISGDKGANVMANFIADRERSKNVYHFYIAGNAIGPSGIEAISNSLKEDKKVTALWLKRNPLTPTGGKHIASMLRVNTTLQTLDLVNTGIQDEGAIAVFNALKENIDNSALEHLYIGTNALTYKTAQAAAEFLSTGKSKLSTLYFACGRLGDQGIKTLAKAISNDKSLTRLGLSSESIGPEGAKALADVLEHHPSILSLDLGLRKGTFELGEHPNCIGDESSLYLVKKLIGPHRKYNPIRLLNLDHNGLSKEGVDNILSYIEGVGPDEGNGLLRMSLAQHKLGSNQDSKTRISTILRRNQMVFNTLKKKLKNKEGENNDGNNEGESESEREMVNRVDEVMEPKHLWDIYSIYRTNM